MIYLPFPIFSRPPVVMLKRKSHFPFCQKAGSAVVDQPPRRSLSIFMLFSEQLKSEHKSSMFGTRMLRINAASCATSETVNPVRYNPVSVTDELLGYPSIQQRGRPIPDRSSIPALKLCAVEIMILIRVQRNIRQF